MWSKAKSKASLAIISIVLIVLLSVVASKLFAGTDRMTMYYDNHQQMEQEILRKIPIGSTPQFAREVMNRNGFTFTRQAGSSLQFEKEESYWPFYVEGTIWTADIKVINGAVSGARVWIGPGD